MSFHKNRVQSFYMSEDEKKWLTEKANTFIKDLGIKVTDKVLDFGTRVGNYALPIAKYLNNTGKVYALDKDKHSLDILKRRSEELGIKNIGYIKTDGSLHVPLSDQSLDYILAFDVLHEVISENCKGTYALLKDFSRLLSKAGKLVLYLPHLNKTGLTREEVEQKVLKDFVKMMEKEIQLLHWDHLMWGSISIYKKSG